MMPVLAKAVCSMGVTLLILAVLVRMFPMDRAAALADTGAIGVSLLLIIISAGYGWVHRDRTVTRPFAGLVAREQSRADRAPRPKSRPSQTREHPDRARKDRHA